jgi:hypothetical protein
MMRCVAAVLIVATMGVCGPHPAVAQLNGLSQFPSLPQIPAPPPPPPPRIEVPVVPQMNAPLPTPRANLQPRGSFSDRISRCLDDGASQGLGPNDRAAYSRGCANQ